MMISSDVPPKAKAEICSWQDNPIKYILDVQCCCLAGANARHITTVFFEIIRNLGRIVGNLCIEVCEENDEEEENGIVRQRARTRQGLCNMNIKPGRRPEL